MRYIVGGGVAVVLQGHPRVTADIDLVIDLHPAAAESAIKTFTKMGLPPRVPDKATASQDLENIQALEPLRLALASGALARAECPEQRRRRGLD